MKLTLLKNLIRLILLSVIPMCLTSLALGEHETPVYKKVLIIGDSITKHGPAEALGWSGNWGMAASAQDKDYVHLFVARLTRSQNGVAPELFISAEGGGKLPDKLKFAARFTAFQPDLAIIQMGENDNTDVTEQGFQKPYEQILEAIRAGSPNAKILCCGVWSQPNGNPVRDGMIRKACQKYNAVFVDLRKANADPLNKAGAEQGRFTHPGVNWHPGDKGMQAYADALWETLTNPAAACSDSSIPAATESWSVEELWNGTPALPWRPASVIDEQNGKRVLKIVAGDPAVNVNVSAALPLEKCKGKKLLISTRVRGENVSDKPLPHNGVKLMVATQNAEGVKDYPQAPLPVGTFDWKEVQWTVSLPDNLISATLVLGLEHVSGTVWFDTVKITAQ